MSSSRRNQQWICCTKPYRLATQLPTRGDILGTTSVLQPSVSYCALTKTKHNISRYASWKLESVGEQIAEGAQCA